MWTRILGWVMSAVGLGTGSAWIWIAVAVGVSVLGGVTTAMLWFRDQAHVAQAEGRATAERLAQTTAAMDEMRRQHVRAMAAVEAEGQAAAARASQASRIRRTIDAAPRTEACVASPAVVAALAGLRRRTDAPAAGGAAARGAGVAADLRGPAGDSRAPVGR